MPSEAVGERYSLWLSAHPRTIVAGSNVTVTISAELRDSMGGTVPDGTPVEFTTSIGVIERQARTVAGIARVRLASGNVVGTAIISAVAPEGGAVADLRVDFLEPGTELLDESFVSVSSENYLGYDGEKRIVDAAGGVRIEHRGLLIEAESVQIDVRKSILRAAGRPGKPMVLSRRDKRVEASALFYDLGTMRGVMLTSAADGAVRMKIRGADLLTSKDDNPDKDISFDFTPVSESKLFIRARSLVIRPGEDIRFKKASYFIDGERMGTVPLQVVPLRSSAYGTGRMLAFGTEGLRVDLPVYYLLTANTAASVRVRHSEPTGWGTYSERAGWQIDLDHDYNRGGSTEGLFSINRVTSGDWGIRWNQNAILDDDAQVYTYIDFPSHRDLFGSVDYRKPMRSYTWSLSARANRYKSSPDGHYAGTFLQSQIKPLFGKAVTYSFNSRAVYDSRQPASQKVGTGLGLQMYGKPIQFNRSTSLSTSFSAIRDWGSTDEGLSIYGNAGISRMLGHKGFLGLNYSYSWTDAFEGYNSQRISGTLSYRPNARWSTNAYSTYGLTDETSSFFGDVAYRISRDWRLSVIGTYQRYLAGKYTDTEYAVRRMVGRQEVSLVYSQSRCRLRLEMSAFGF